MMFFFILYLDGLRSTRDVTPLSETMTTAAGGHHLAVSVLVNSLGGSDAVKSTGGTSQVSCLSRLLYRMLQHS